MPIRDLMGPSYLGLAAAAAAAAALALGIPTDIVPNPLFTRMTPIEPEQFVFWIATSILTGALLATYLEPSLRKGLAGQGVGVGILGLFAVGCPICNKLVVAMLGASGAFTYFAPIQPILGAAAVGLVSYGLWVRLRALRTNACRRSARG
jgi:predicted membrane protein